MSLCQVCYYVQRRWARKHQRWAIFVHTLVNNRLVKVNLLTASLSHRNYATVNMEPELGWTDSRILKDLLHSDRIITWLINIQVVAEQISNKVERSTKLPVQQSRPCWIQLCCQCVPGFSELISYFITKSSLMVRKIWLTAMTTNLRVLSDCDVRKDDTWLTYWLCCIIVIIVSVSSLILDNISGYGFFRWPETEII